MLDSFSRVGKKNILFHDRVLAKGVRTSEESKKWGLVPPQWLKTVVKEEGPMNRPAIQLTKKTSTFVSTPYRAKTVVEAMSLSRHCASFIADRIFPERKCTTSEW